MRILVTGATGFIGGRLTESLVADGHRVRALVRPTSDASCLKSLGVELVQGDLLDQASIENAVEGCEQVYHLAAATSRKRGSRLDYREVNVTGMEHVARASLACGVSRLVYSSTVGVYGTSGPSPLTEDSPVRPNSAYRETKLAGEEVARRYHRLDKLPVVIARLATVMGPGALHWLPFFDLVGSGRLRLIGTGENRIPLTDVTDVVDGLRRCGETPHVGGDCYLLAGRESMPLREFVRTLAQELGAGTPSLRLPAFPYRAYLHLASHVYRHLHVELPRASVYHLFLEDRACDISSARDRLGYGPTVGAAQTLRRTVEWLREQGHLAGRAEPAAPSRGA